eukprot:Gb_36021 [translate_table: standard]
MPILRPYKHSRLQPHTNYLGCLTLDGLPRFNLSEGFMRNCLTLRHSDPPLQLATPTTTAKQLTKRTPFPPLLWAFMLHVSGLSTNDSIDGSSYNDLFPLMLFHGHYVSCSKVILPMLHTAL